VVVCGHPVAEPEIDTDRVNSELRKSIGYFASDNAANRDALGWLLDSIWPLVVEQDPDIRLVLAGGVCAGVNLDSPPERVRFFGRVDRIEDFYTAVDLVLNPIRFGTGLKIKNIEAIQFARPLVSTAHGVEAMTRFELGDSPWAVADTAQDFAAAIIKIVGSVELRLSMIENAKELAKQLTPEAVYKDWLEYVREIRGL